MDLGLAISRLREQRGMNQKSLSQACNITQAYLSQIENNKKEPRLSTLQAISTALSVPLPVIFFLSIDGNDIPARKKELYKILEPLIKSFINDIYIENNV